MLAGVDADCGGGGADCALLGVANAEDGVGADNDVVLPLLAVRDGVPPPPPPPLPLMSDSLSFLISSLGKGRAAGADRVGVAIADELLDADMPPGVAAGALATLEDSLDGVSATLLLPTLAGEPLRMLDDVRPDPPPPAAASNPSASCAVCWRS